jgi:hypothetical protein
VSRAATRGDSADRAVSVTGQQITVQHYTALYRATATGRIKFRDVEFLVLCSPVQQQLYILS